MNWEIRGGDALDRLREMPDESVHCVVTSPPYFGLRSYIADGHELKPLELGLEPTPAAYLARMVEVFREVRRVMRSDAVMFLNVGDSYQDKQLLMMPARLALALQDDGWFLRSEIIWAKLNPMPESVQGSHAYRHRVTIGEYERLSSLRTAEGGNEDGASDLSDVRARAIPDREAEVSTERTGQGDGSGEGRTAGRARAATAVLGLGAGATEQSEVRRQPEGESDRGEEGSELPRTGSQRRGDSDGGRLAVDFGTARLPVLLLPEAAHETNARPCDPAEQGRPEFTGERGASLPLVQLEEEGQDSPSLLVDCPGCQKCEAHGGYIHSLGAGRPTKAHEQIFLLTKSARYFYDADAIREPAAYPDDDRKARAIESQKRFPTADVAGIRGGSATYPARNARTVWTIATQPFSGAPLLADYVGADGKPYRRSPDCPIHGQQDRLETPRTGECDEQPDRSLSDNPGSDFRPDGELSGGRASICETTSGRTDDESERQQTRESKEKSKTLALTPTHSAGGRVGDARSAIDTMHIPERHGPRDGSSDSPYPASADAASPHSNEAHKTGRAPATSQPCMPSAETLGSTAGTSALPGFDVLSGHTPENSNGQGDSADLPSAQTKRRIVDRPSQCNCTIVNVDHFATFPEELPRRCILAGTSERGVCPECGAPWKRVVERASAIPQRDGGLKTNTPGIRNDAGNGRAGGFYPVAPESLGWEPTCTHGGEPVPAVVLDPFAGSGTTIMVALQLGRSGLGIELNPEYAAMARRRIVNDAPLFNSMAAAGG